MNLPTVSASACGCASLPESARAVGAMCEPCRLLYCVRELLETALRFEGDSLPYGVDRETGYAVERLLTAYEELADEAARAAASAVAAGDRVTWGREGKRGVVRETRGDVVVVDYEPPGCRPTTVRLHRSEVRPWHP